MDDFHRKVQEFYKTLDRSVFIDNDNKQYAGADQPLPIGYGQTISQPSLVALMTELLHPGQYDRTLEIGTGSGYQTAFLAEFSSEVHTVEIIPQLSAAARRHLEKFPYGNIHFHIGDGSIGWPSAAPYNRIMVTAAADAVPQALLEQLAPGGCMVIPVGPGYVQDLIVVEKDAEGNFSYKNIEQVRFVRLVSSGPVR
jgi:protein-L-isoaspartate(D-aspartate) O-methyltransferase